MLTPQTNSIRTGNQQGAKEEGKKRKEKKITMLLLAAKKCVKQHFEKQRATYGPYRLPRYDNLKGRVRQGKQRGST
jgi:hypothetical protein